MPRREDSGGTRSYYSRRTSEDAYSDSFYSDSETDSRVEMSRSKKQNTTKKKAPPVSKKVAQKGGRTSKQTGTPRGEPNQVAKRMLSARRLKINELRNEIEELQQYIDDLKQDNRSLKITARRQEKALQDKEGQENDLPNMIHRHNDEIRSLKEQLRRYKDRYSKAHHKEKDLLVEIDKQRAQNKELKKLVEKKNLKDRDELSKRLHNAELDIEDKDKRIEELERHLEILNKNHRHELAIEIHRHRDTQRRNEELVATVQRLEMALREKEKVLEIRNIYSHRVIKAPHKLSSVPGSPVAKHRTETSRSEPVETPREKAKAMEELRRKEEKQKNEDDTDDIELERKRKREESMKRKFEMEQKEKAEREEAERQEQERKKEELERERREQEKLAEEERQKDADRKLIEDLGKDNLGWSYMKEKTYKREDSEDEDFLKAERERIKKKADEEDRNRRELEKKRLEQQRREKEDRERREKEEREERLRKEREEEELQAMRKREKELQEERERERKLEFDKMLKEENNRKINGFDDGKSTSSSGERWMKEDEKERKQIEEEEARKKKDLLLKRLRDMDEDKASDDDDFFDKKASAGSRRKEYNFSQPIENLHQGKPAQKVAVPYLEKQRKKSLEDDDLSIGYNPSFSSANKNKKGNDLDSDFSSGYQPTFSSTNTNTKAKKKNDLMKDLFGENDNINRTKRAGSGDELDDNPFNKPVRVTHNKDRDSPNSNNRLLPKRTTQQPSSFRPIINAVDDVDDEIEEVIL